MIVMVMILPSYLIIVHRKKCLSVNDEDAKSETHAIMMIVYVFKTCGGDGDTSTTSYLSGNYLY